jgi:hypothetical protein
LFRKYASVWVLLFIMVFLFTYVTMPSVQMNHHLNRVRAKRIEEIEVLREKEKTLIHLNRALDEDPITIENRLRQSFSNARRMGEEEIDAPSP